MCRWAGVCFWVNSCKKSVQKKNANTAVLIGGYNIDNYWLMTVKFNSHKYGVCTIFTSGSPYSSDENRGDRHDQTTESGEEGEDLGVGSWRGRENPLKIDLPGNPPQHLETETPQETPDQIKPNSHLHLKLWNPGYLKVNLTTAVF